MRIALCWYVAATLTVACRYEAPPRQAAHPQLRQRTVWQRTDLTGKKITQKFVLQPHVLSRCEAGSRLGNDNLVATPASKFGENDEIYMSMWLSHAPEGLQLSMRVLDADDNEIGTATRDDAGGARAATIQVGEPLKPGRYTLQGFWGGNMVCEKQISVVRGVGGAAEGSEKT